MGTLRLYKGYVALDLEKGYRGFLKAPGPQKAYENDSGVLINGRGLGVLCMNLDNSIGTSAGALVGVHEALHGSVTKLCTGFTVSVVGIT